MKILFVCEGNYARSQIAEAYYNYLTCSSDAISAGISDSAGRYPIPKEIIDLMKEDGVDISLKQSKQLTKEMVEKTDKVYVLCEGAYPDYLLKSGAVFWKIEDLKSKDTKTMRRIRDCIKKHVKRII